MPRGLLPAMVGDDPLDKLTSASIGSMKELEQQLRGVRERGYALNLGESQPGVAAVAVAMSPLSSAPRAALSVAGPRQRMTAEVVRRIAVTLKRAVDLLEKKLRETEAH